MSIYKVILTTGSTIHQLEYSAHTEISHHKIYLLNYPSDQFIFEVDAVDSVTLPLKNGYTYSCTVNWGDNSSLTSINSYSDPHSHTYSSPGLYTIRISGECGGFATNNVESIQSLITRVLQWGTSANFQLLNFYGCTNLYYIPDGNINGANNITTFANFLRDCTSFKGPIDQRLFTLTTGVTSFSAAFMSSGVEGNIPETLFSTNTLVTDFGYTFYGTNLGNDSETLSGNLFSNCPLVTTFEATFMLTKFTCVIPTGLFSGNTEVTTFSYTFNGTPFSGIVPATLFESAGTSVIYFVGTFANTNISGIPDHLFWENTEVITFYETFVNCDGLVDNSTLGYPVYNDNLFSQNTKVTTFYRTFFECSNVSQELPAYMFSENTKVNNFTFTFANNHALYGSIPSTFFETNTGVTTFYGTFRLSGYAWYSLSGEIPADLFANCPLVTTFQECFRWQLSLENAPTGLFRNNLLATNFYQTFSVCQAMQLEQYVFCTDASSAYSRFSGQTIDFRLTFNLNRYYGGVDTRYAPELWDPTIYSMSGSSYTDCFNWNNVGDDPYINDSAIPTDWK